MDPMEQKSKMSMLKALKDEMGGMMKDDMSPENMKKVTVAAPDSDSLKSGLDKAKDLVGQGSDGMNMGGMAGYAEGGEVEGDPSKPEDSSEHDEYAAKNIKPGSSDLPEDARGEPSGDDEEVEKEIGKYLEDPSEMNLDSLRACLDKKKSGQY